MAILLMRLRGVPEDEAEAVRELLEQHRMDFYETPPDRWGVSMPAIWLRDDSRKTEAKALIADYQAGRRRQARDDYEQRRREGETETIYSRMRRHPVRSLVYLGTAAVVLYLSLMPFLEIG